MATSSHRFNVKVFSSWPRMEMTLGTAISVLRYEPSNETDNVSEFPTDDPMEVLKEEPQAQEQTRPLLTQTKLPEPEHGPNKPR